jgi:hypothetical protein
MRPTRITPSTTPFACCLALLLSACATTQPPSVASIAAKVQADYPVVKAVASIYTTSGKASPATVALIAKAETITDPEVAALSSLSTPASVRAALNDLSTMVAALPPGAIPPATRADITLLLALANASLAGAQ